MAETMSSEDYQEVGRRYYKQKDFASALEAFSKAIDIAVIPGVGLYDHRAACYEKLADFDSAVRDGREMIRTNKKDIKGYLRTGSTLEKQNKLEKALAIYKYGMKNVPIDNKHFMYLQQTHDRLTRKLSPAKATDPFTVLPVELAEEVLSYLTFKNVVNCLRVCKGWKTYLIRRPKLWTDFDLSGARKNVSRAFVQSVVRRSDYSIHRAIIHRFNHADVIRNLVTACKGLTHLEIVSGDFGFDSLVEIAQCALNLKKFVLHHEVTMETASQILRRRPGLEHAEFRRLRGNVPTNFHGPFPSLQTFIAAGDRTAPSRPNFSSFLSQSPVLQNLTLVNFTPLSISTDPDFSAVPLTRLELSNYDLRQRVFPRLPSTLTHLSLRPAVQYACYQNWSMDPWGGISWQNLRSSHLPRLNYLSLSNFSALTPAWFTALLETQGDESGQNVPADPSTLEHLQHFSIRDCINDTDYPQIFMPVEGNPIPESPTMRSGCGLLGSFRILSPSLLSLDLSSLPATDKDIKTLLTHPVSSLQTVNLSSTRVTGAGVKMLVDKVPTLRFLNLDFCTHISSRDIKAYAESKGVSVSWAVLPQNGGRKLRYE
ncbi:hypothetical protein P154DRAFT_615452 [Amniculicola lignicola CBS 123094]|uniref:F-box domain-containing protein n=1 Tax=Amniculicola lignicola CBS 123094 TaxID=1392246 RepID=A0A6A5WZ07_9PLEO|nr:hypothetical protein P154DRAFT_615452 [Amniculicola lignicola CBS 123094]